MIQDLTTAHSLFNEGGFRGFQISSRMQHLGMSVIQLALSFGTIGGLTILHIVWQSWTIFGFVATTLES